MIIALDRFTDWFEQQGIPTQRTSEYIEAMTRQMNLSTILTGSGSPEGAVIAEPTALYMDTAGTAGNILYIKKTGTSDTGWILV